MEGILLGILIANTTLIIYLLCKERSKFNTSTFVNSDRDPTNQDCIAKGGKWYNYSNGKMWIQSSLNSKWDLEAKVQKYD